MKFSTLAHRVLSKRINIIKPIPTQPKQPHLGGYHPRIKAETLAIKAPTKANDQVIQIIPKMDFKPQSQIVATNLAQYIFAEVVKYQNSKARRGANSEASSEGKVVKGDVGGWIFLAIIIYFFLYAWSTILKQAEERQKKVLVVEFLEKFPNIVKLNELDENGQGLIHKAVNLNFMEFLQTMIKVGADVNLRNKDFETPVMLAAKAGQMVSIYHLRKAGADLNLKNNDGNTAFLLAVERNNILSAKELLEGKADIYIRNNHGIAHFTTRELTSEMALLVINAQLNPKPTAKVTEPKGLEVKVEELGPKIG